MPPVHASQARGERSVTVPWITASEWTADGPLFSVTADLDGLLREHGDGIYTLVVWAAVGDEDVVISQHSIFHGVTPPGAREGG